MKYLKKFQTNADYQAFKVSSNWVTPNVSVTEDNTIIYYNPIPPQLFPLTLVEGETSENGRLLYEYICNNYEPEREINITEEINIATNGSTGGVLYDNETVKVVTITTTNNYNYTYGKSITATGVSLILNQYSAANRFVLTPDGYVTFCSYEPPAFPVSE